MVAKAHCRTARMSPENRPRREWADRGGSAAPPAHLFFTHRNCTEEGGGLGLVLISTCLCLRWRSLSSVGGGRGRSLHSKRWHGDSHSVADPPAAGGWPGAGAPGPHRPPLTPVGGWVARTSVYVYALGCIVSRRRRPSIFVRRMNFSIVNSARCDAAFVRRISRLVRVRFLEWCVYFSVCSKSNFLLKWYL